MQTTKLRSVVALMLLSCGLTAHAEFMMLPAGLNPGDQYRLVFVTSGTTNATSTNIQDYNDFAFNQASLNPALLSLGTSWKAIGSTHSVHAADNTGTNPMVLGVPIYNLSGDLIASSNADLWDNNLIAPILYDQSGANRASVSVWTGTLPNGNRDIELFFGDTFVITGSPAATSFLWTEGAALNANATHHLYAISGILTAMAVPEPGSLAMVGLGAFVLAGSRRRRV
jgi:PEP-CTERM motif